MQHLFDNVKSVYNIENFSRLTNRNQFNRLIRLKDPLIFAQELLGVKLFDYQKEILVNNDLKLHIRKGRQIGASFILALKTVIKVVLTPDITVAIISPSQRQSSLVFKYIQSIFQSHELLKPDIENKESRYSQTVIQLPNGSIIYSLPCGNDGRTIRGISIATGSMMIIDEAAFIPDKVWEAIDYFTALGGQEIISSTPLGKFGRFYDSSKDSLYTHMHIPTRRNPLISQQWIDGKKGLRSYKSEILGEFMAGEGAFFDADIIRECIDAEQVWNESPVKSVGLFKTMGVDVGIEVDPTVATVCKKCNDIWVPIFIQAYKKKNNKCPYKLEYVAVRSYGEILKELNGICNRYGVNHTAVDVTYNPYLGERLEETMETYPIKFNSLAPNGSPMKTELMHNLLAHMSDGQLKIPNHPTLLRQLYNYEYTITEAGGTTFSPKDEDFIDSLALSLYTDMSLKEVDNFAV